METSKSNKNQNRNNKVLTVPMRNGNHLSRIPNHIANYQFLPYLWGMETHSLKSPLSCYHGSYRTYEEWKPIKCQCDKVVKLSSYRTYEEWKRSGSTKGMRLKICSYRTYEEWKLGVVGGWRDEWYVLTVPMRNGNILSLYLTHYRLSVLTVPMRNGNKMQSWSMFLGNLSSYRTYEEWKLADPGCSHIHPNSSYRTYEEWKLMKVKSAILNLWVLTVPMRNGNILIMRNNSPWLNSSYRTYEEWKRMWYNNMCRSLVGSYRTYEEWKLSKSVSIFDTWQSSYRTYEEWKPGASGTGKTTYAKFLPYLWGMETQQLVWCWLWR